MKSIGMRIAACVVIVGVGGACGRSSPGAAEEGSGGDASATRPAAAAAQPPAQGAAQTPARPTEPVAAPAAAQGGFEGRYRRGAEVAPVRIVVFTDYQCPDCDQLDQMLDGVIMGRPEVAVSVKHFPFSRGCNPNVPQDMHPNACWAARAAETAGILRGRDGFWAMHRWLFSRRGGFTDAELRDGLVMMGYDAAEFQRVMTSPVTLQAVQGDIAEAMGYGLTGTPMLFINGREVQNWRVAGVVERAVNAAAESPPETSAADRPPTALEKHMSDWRTRPRVASVVDATAGWMGDGAVTVVVWGDMQEPNTVEADAEVRRLVAAGRPVRYSFRHFPVDQACNSAAPRTLHPAACAAARVREAAFLAGGNEAGWRAHAWLFGNVGPVKMAADGGRGASGVAGVAAGALGLDAGALVTALARPEVEARIGGDAAAASRLGVTSIPMVYVDGRFMQRWRMTDGPLIARAVEEAAGGGK